MSKRKAISPASDDDSDSDLPVCKYGTSCFRKNPDHFKQFAHPHLKKKVKDDVAPIPSPAIPAVAPVASPASPAAAAAIAPSPPVSRPSVSVSAAASPPMSTPSSSSAWKAGSQDDDGDDETKSHDIDMTKDDDSSSSKRPTTPVTEVRKSLPPCPYGVMCFRRNLLHFSEYSHPIRGTSTTESGAAKAAAASAAAAAAAKSSSPAAAAASAAAADSDAAPSSTQTLQRTYSSMSEAERKMLILQALQEKEKLQAKLKEKEEEMEAKEKEFANLKAGLGSTGMMLPGEKEALEGDSVKVFNLKPQRTFDANDAASMHFRLAESQFYRLLQVHSSTTHKVTSVDYVVSPKVFKQFEEAKKKIASIGGICKPVLGFHGTADKNIKPITETGFRMPGKDGHKHATDTGWYGKGIYFSEYPSYSMSYIKGQCRLLLCQVLLGRVFKCTKLIHGAALSKGHDSHMSPDGKELVIFDSSHILPCYIVNFKTTNGYEDFKYDEPGGDSSEKKTKGGKAKAVYDVGASAFTGAAAGAAGLFGTVFSAVGTMFGVSPAPPLLIKSKQEQAHEAGASNCLQGVSFLLGGKYEETQVAIKNLIMDHQGLVVTKPSASPGCNALVYLCPASEWSASKDDADHKIAHTLATYCSPMPTKGKGKGKKGAAAAAAAAASDTTKGYVVKPAFLYDFIVDPKNTDINNYVHS